ncbi:uncharacterized protein LOC134250086 [Saccostrea cucullata]|uniref:uncharacterized protein LOC134250086 n=1 Tax=Saccostrea cuccullata TaxID=36930 RepID=UPI002ED2D002
MNLYSYSSFFLYFVGILLKYTTGLRCDCTTEECLEQGTRKCVGTWCYSETYNGFVEAGCSDQWQPLLCENRLSSKLPQLRISHCCNDKDFCNKNVVPTQAPPHNNIDTKEKGEIAHLDSNYDDTKNKIANPNSDLTHDADHTDCPCALNGPSKDSSKMLNPIYIAVPVAGVCVLLALVIFAMYLLRRRTDYYERYNYPRNVTVPPCHVISGGKQNSSPCKINRCTDSERSSASSETKLFL